MKLLWPNPWPTAFGHHEFFHAATVVAALMRIAYLGWLQPILHGDRPTRTWVRIVPIVFLVAVVFGINYCALADRA